ncbi:TcaA second domain-containing protein [Sporolactobacillus inulinus]|jgi:hypothetical protein|uniref:Uncharacterized protein n=1 Tax=Sporolactobacillus inulinus CASD TaxID=1069536 RepID=A0A0U1QMK4_9BACL|nr:hypothetical protein [Sporolactobacillus inulinus]KLI02035.1 hypothetical protein SINU_10210 [Sporolactobacillus inulinus CASD]GEB77321.1 hypothetical protein SIN01_16660 [Sporolactobacillus inulinus]
MEWNKRIKIIIGSSVVFVALLISVGIGWAKTSPKNVVEDFKQAVNENDAAALKPLLVTGDKNAPITKASTQALLAFLRSNKSAARQVTQSLTEQAGEKNTDGDGVLQLSEDGRQFLFFKKYKIEVEPQSITVYGLREGEVLALNTSERGILRKGNSYGPILPGNYKIKQQLTNDLGIFMKDAKISAWDQEVSIHVDSEAWMAHAKSLQKAVFDRINQFNAEVSDWETSDYAPQKLPSATETLAKTQSALRIREFAALKDQLDGMQSAYLGMLADPDSLTITHYGNQWNVSVDTVVSYKFGYTLKKGKEQKDASYNRGITFRLIYDTTQKHWLVSGLSDNYITKQAASEWPKKQQWTIDHPQLHTWGADSGTDL